MTSAIRWVERLALCACIATPGCAGGQSRSPQDGSDFLPDARPLGKTMVYDCNGYQFTARLGPGEMAVWLPDRYLVLSQVRSSSGTLYQEADVEFWIQGDEAALTVAHQQYLNCAQRPEQVPWEDARRRGVNFRAVGNEPGWSLEIRDGQHLLLVTDYGMQRVVTPDPGLTREGAARRYHAVTESADLTVEIVDETCFDTMADASYPSQVTATLNGQVLRGCGRDLDYPWE